jgi:hypothetical protein
VSANGHIPGSPGAYHEGVTSWVSLTITPPREEAGHYAEGRQAGAGEAIANKAAGEEINGATEQGPARPGDDTPTGGTKPYHTE